MVMEVHDNATYSLCKLDEMQLRVVVAGKRIKVFKRRDGKFSFEDITNLKTTNSDQDNDVD